MIDPFKKGTKVTLFLTSIGFFIFTLLPFWIFGSFSVIGWYDEIDQVIPWYYQLSLALEGTSFVHTGSGGVGVAHGFFQGNEQVSFYRFLMSNFDMMTAHLIFRFFGLWTCFLGVWVLLRKQFKLNHFLAFSFALFIPVSTVFP